MITSSYLVLLVAMVSVGAYGNGKVTSQIDSERPERHLSRSKRHVDLVDGILSKVSLADLTKRTRTRRDLDSKNVESNAPTGNSLSPLNKRHVYDELMRYMLGSHQGQHNLGNVNEDKMILQQANKNIQDIMHDPILSKLGIKPGGKRNDFYTPILHTLRGKRAHGTQAYPDTHYSNHVIRIPFGRRTSQKTNAHPSLLKRDLSAAYGNFGGPFGKRGASTGDVYSGSETAPEQIISEKLLKFCLHLNKLGILVGKCDDLRKMAEDGLSDDEHLYDLSQSSFEETS